ncbi:MAG: hypothetical protein F4Y01_10750 [Gammaproteobacteria bacterium]|nr:hypothetical protein [Gammaproteobacteria bacterium]
MSNDADDRLRTNLTELEKRVRTLESRVNRPILVAALSGIIFPIIIVMLTHRFIDLPAETGKFEGRFEFVFDKDGPKYVLIVKNIGSRRAVDMFGTARLSFPATISKVDKSKALATTTYSSDNDNDGCKGAFNCIIRWGGLEPDGELEIGFFTRHSPSQFPEVSYGGNYISNWHCEGLSQYLMALCERKDSKTRSTGRRGLAREGTFGEGRRMTTR